MLINTTDMEDPRSDALGAVVEYKNRNHILRASSSFTSTILSEVISDNRLLAKLSSKNC
jgi:hypothetical protein